MSSKHFLDYFMYLVVIVLTIVVKHTICGEASISRSLDLSIPAWRPLVQNPHLQHYYQNVPQPSPHLISYTHLGAAHKDEIIEAAKINAQTLKKFNDYSAQQPITSYSNPYPIHSQTPVPVARQPAAAASNVMHARLPYPGKSSALYSTKLNFLGKPELSHHHHHHHIGIHQNSIHQTIATTPKVAGFTKEQGGRVNFHYHHPSFGLSSIFDTTTKRIPMFGSSVTPLASTKVHPVMSKFQAHMALAAISQQQQQNKLNKMKIAQQHRPSSSSSSNEFSPPSQIISNYANYETATRVPHWHHGFPSTNLGVGAPSSSNLAGSGSHKGEATQLILPSVHPSIITPFIEQVQLKAKQAIKQSQESSSSENNGSYEVVNDVFSQDLVPPPSSSSNKKHRNKVEKVPKFNLSMKSPLQDASRFNYENVISTATPGSTIATHHENNNKFRPSHSDQSSGEKPNVFVHLNRPKENVYKHHKQLHPSYTGGPKKKQSFGQQQEKPPHFLPTPYEASKEIEEIKIDYGRPQQHSFFTIEDAVTPHFVDNVKHQNEYNDEFEIITLRPQVKPTYASFTAGPSLFSTLSTTHITPSPQTAETPDSFVVPSSSPKPKGKLRRRKPKPHLQQQQQQQQQSSVKVPTIKEVSSEETSTSTYRPPTAPAHLTSNSNIRTRGHIKSSNSSNTHENELKTRNRLNHPNRVRTRPNFTSPSATLPTAPDYDFTLNPIEAERKSEVSSTQRTLEGGVYSTKSTERDSIEQAQPDVKHRVRLRYKNKLNLKSNSLEKLSGDNQISDSENENVVVVKQPAGSEEASEFTVATEQPFNEVKSSLKLPNLKLRNEALTTIALPTVESQTVSSTSASSDENVGSNILNKIARPRFSIKELKRKQFLNSSPASSVSTTVLTSSTSSTTPRPDGNRFNRYRLNLHRKRNETSNVESSGEQENEQPSTPRRRYQSSTRFSVSTSTTESTLTPVPSKRGNTLPKRTFPVRNFTRPSSDNNGETTTSHKPSYISKGPTNRPSVPSLRQRIQNYKRKETANEIVDSEHEESIKNVNFELDTTIPNIEPTATPSVTSILTEVPITRETSIMKIAKTSQSSHPIRATTSNSIEDTLLPSSSTTLSERHDSSDLIGSPSEHSQRVAELTVSANENSTFKSANIGLLSRRIPNYFTISTDDPILPIQAFFPQIKTNESN